MLIGYGFYLLELQNSSLQLALRFKEHVDLREQFEVLHTVGNIEIGFFAACLSALVFVYFRNGSLDRTLLVYALLGILVFSSVNVVGLDLYYQHIINLLGI